MNYFDSGDKSLCCACTACVNVCPMNCIEMRENYDGFLYPSIDMNRCISCMLCRKVCPLADEHSVKLANEPQEDCYAFTARNVFILENSTSGGAFATIVNGFCTSDDDDYVVYGVKYTDNLELEYTYITDKKDISDFGGSKYFQSEVNKSFIEIKDFLEQGKKVVFSGTPCHVAGLKSFLVRNYANLLCVDVLCFGVPSKKAFSSYRKYLEKKYNDKLIGYKFRSKGNSEVIAEFNQKGKKRIRTSNDYYMRGFYSRKMHRECCTKCQFKKTTRQGDISIGDFWGISDINDRFDFERGVSLVIFNTEKGKLLLGSFMANGQMERFNIDCAVPHNQLKPYEWQVNKEIYNLIDKNIDFNNAIKRALPLTLYNRITSTLSSLLPSKIKAFIKKL